MVTPISEENSRSEAEPISEQQDEEGSPHVDSGSSKEEPRTKKRRLTDRSHSNGDDHCLTSEIQCGNRTDPLQLHECKDKRVLAVEQLWNQERNSSLHQEDQDAAQVKVEVEEEELWISQEEERVEQDQESDTFFAIPTFEENNSETQSNGDQLPFHSSSDTPSQDQEADTQDKEVLAFHQLWNQERNSSLNQEDQDAAQDKLEDQELWANHEEEQRELEQESDTFMVTLSFEENDSETESNSDQLLSHSSLDTESQDQGVGYYVNPGSHKHKEPVNEAKVSDICWEKNLFRKKNLIEHTIIHTCEKKQTKKKTGALHGCRIIGCA
ncbi:uncharacterized protein KZ484_025294 [Pholidichthys leucotaenia]